MRWTRLTVCCAVMVCALLAGCATTIRSDVTAFHEWPAELPDKSFVFERSATQNNNLEYLSYENLVRAELIRLGFVDAADARSAAFRVGMNYAVNVRDVRVIEPVLVDPWYGSPYYGPYYGPRWGPLFGPGYYGPGLYGPFYDPFWYGPPVTTIRDSRFQLYSRQLKVSIARAADSRQLYDVTVNSEGANGSLPAVMPYLVRSAFLEFPGPSGKPRVVELTVQ